MTTLPAWAQVLVVLLGAAAVGRLGSGLMPRLMGPRVGPAHAASVGRVFAYGLAAFFAVSALKHLGFDLSVALGFASQTAASNLISGLFLLVERPFVVGDSIELGELRGEVVAIDMLSVKVRTFDNRLVRVPNERLLKMEITNLSALPIRRIDLPLRVRVDADTEAVEALLGSVAAANPHCLDEPPPLLQVRGFGENGIELQYSVWCARESFLRVRSEVVGAVALRFAAEGVELPMPQRRIAAAVGGAPIAVRVVESSEP